jgi:hypothetical protein
MEPTDCVWDAIQGVISVTRTVVPGGRAAIAAAIGSVSGAGTMVPKAGVALPRAEILHFATELFEAPLKLGIVRCWSNARE